MKITEAIEKYEKIKKSGWEKGVYLIVRENSFTFIRDGHSINNCNISKEWLVNDTWEEYTGDYEINFKKNGTYFTILPNGDIYENVDGNCSEDVFFENFNYFPNRELAEYIAKKQLLERKLMVFSYLNGAYKINWNNDNVEKYTIDSYIDEYFNVNKDHGYTYKCFNNIYFSTEEIRDTAIELYKNEMEEVIRMSFNFGF